MIQALPYLMVAFAFWFVLYKLIVWSIEKFAGKTRPIMRGTDRN